MRYEVHYLPNDKAYVLEFEGKDKTKELVNMNHADADKYRKGHGAS